MDQRPKLYFEKYIALTDNLDVIMPQYDLSIQRSVWSVIRIDKFPVHNVKANQFPPIRDSEPETVKTQVSSSM